MRIQRTLVVLASLITVVLFAIDLDRRPEVDHYTVALAQHGTPMAGDFCPGVPYSVVLDPIGPDTPEGMFEGLSDRINQLQNEERIVWVIGPLLEGDDGTFTVDLRLFADTEATIEAILATPAVLQIVDGQEFAELSVGIGTMVPSSPQPVPFVDNGGLFDAYVSDTTGEPVLRLVLTRSSVQTLATVVADAAGGDQTLAIILDREVIDAQSISAPVPTAVDTAISEPALSESDADTLAVALRAGHLPGQLDVEFLMRPPEGGCFG